MKNTAYLLQLTFIDNLKFTNLKGPLLEESHYYPFGIEMSTISSHSLPSYVPTVSRKRQRFGNRYKANGGAACVPIAVAYREYSGEEWSNNTGLEMYETFYRSYNAQVGKFMQGDPKMEVSGNSYLFSANNPVMFTDLLGDQMKYMDSRGNVWHHRDPLEGTPMAGIPYTEGWGSDGFGDMFNNGLGGGDRGKGRNGSQVDYTSQWEDIIAGLKSGKGDTWKPGYGFYDKSLYPEDAKWVELEEVRVEGNISQQRHWDMNKDGILQKAEADYWYLNGNGKEITVDGNKINLEGLSAKDMTYNPSNGTYALPTTKAFDTLPYETAATYGGSIFKLVDGKWQMLSQRYHYNMREWNSKENIIRNLLTIFGDPSNTLRPSEMNKVHPNFTPTGKYFTIIIKY